MKLGIVGPGIMSIPPTGWGAVEILIWDYKCELEKLGHEVHIINTPDQNKIVSEVNNLNLDFVHIQYDNFWNVIPRLNTPKKAITSHFGYIDRIGDHPIANGYMPIFNGFKAISNSCYIFSLSDSIKQKYISHSFNPDKIKVTPNGARKDLFSFKLQPVFSDRSLYLAKIDYRKRQSLIQKYNANVYFAGNIADNSFKKDSFYLGEWKKDYLYEHLTDYSNLVLLSDGEADPLVTKEALMAGLGLVISQWSTANLDVTKPFISVIPENKINDISYVKNIIEQNRIISNSMRNEIKEYGNSFDWSIITKNYIDTINSI